MSTRYPPAFEIFKPVCRETRFDRCTPEAIVNAYDNTIAYTDYVLDRLVGERQLGLDGLDVGDRIDLALDMGDVVVLEAAQHVYDRIDLADVG